MDIKRPAPYQPIPKDANLVFSGKSMKVYSWKQELFDGTATTYESTVRPDSVTVIPITENGKILLLDQIQSGFSDWFLSFPGGQIDPGESPEAAANRELLEETGTKANQLVLWDSSQPFSRMDWAVYTFIGRGCEKIADLKLDGGERIKVREVSFEEFLDIVEDDNFRHVDISLQILKMKLHRKKIEKLKIDLGI